MVRETTDDQLKGWRLARWAQADRTLPPELPHTPNIVDPVTNILQCDSRGKSQAFTRAFFPGETDESSLQPVVACYPPPISSDRLWTTVTLDDVQTAITWMKKDKAPGPDKVQVKAIHLAREELCRHLHLLFQACLNNGYHPRCFKDALIVPLRKPQKPDYTKPRAWRPISLLNTLGKLLEAIIARKIRGVAEHYHLLPATQMGVRQGRDAPMAVDLLTDQVHTAWETYPKSVASILSLDMTGAFDYVPHERLRHCLRTAGFPSALVDWVSSFNSDRTSRILIQDAEIDCNIPQRGLPQGSPASPILFILNTAGLVSLCNEAEEQATSIAFSDDITLLAVGKSTADTTATLSRLNRRCLEWADEWGMRFAPEKYELIHLTRKPNQHDLAIGIDLGNIRCAPSATMRILGFHLDTRLR